MTEDKHRDIDLAGILNNPADFSEEELKSFFADEENRMEYMAVRRAQQAERRAAVVPDADKEWEDFARKHFHGQTDTERNGHRKAAFRYFLAALGGAAAMLLVMLAFHHFSPAEDAGGRLVAMEYDDSPQNITMDIDGKGTKSLAKRDSISFFPSHPDRQADHRGTGVAAPALEKELADGGTRTLKTPRGMDLKVTLPDGSEVWLNAESSLEFPTAFSDARRVMLKGEAYFKVARDEKRPFIVTTDKMNVKVLGTEFNFRHYDNERTQVALINGSVEILNADNTATDIVLQPGQGANVDKQGQIRVQQVDTYAAIQWVDGYFYFQNQTLISALREIARWYNVGVVFENTDAANEKIHFSALRKETLQQTLDKLNRLMHTRITVKNHQIIVR